MTSFVPTEKPETSQAAAQQRGVSALLSDPERRRQRAIGRVESLEQRRQIALPEVDLREARGTAVAGQPRDQRVDDLLLARAETERFAQTLLLEQQIGGEVFSFTARKPADPVEHLIQRRQRVGELAERDRALRRAPAEADRRRPVFGAPK